MIQYQSERLEGIGCNKKDCPFWDEMFEGYCNACIKGNPMIETCLGYYPEKKEE